MSKIPYTVEKAEPKKQEAIYKKYVEAMNAKKQEQKKKESK